MCSTDVITYNNAVAFKKCIINPIFFMTNVMIDDPTFYINLTPKGNNNEGSPEEQEIIVNNPYKDICEQYGIEVEEGATKEDIEEAIKQMVDDNKTQLFVSSDIMMGAKPFAFLNGQLLNF